MTEIILLVNDRTHKPYRVKVDGFILLDSKGEPKRFSSTLKAMSFAQRYAEKRGNEPVVATQLRGIPSRRTGRHVQDALLLSSRQP